MAAHEHTDVKKEYFQSFVPRELQAGLRILHRTLDQQLVEELEKEEVTHVLEGPSGTGKTVALVRVGQHFIERVGADNKPSWLVIFVRGKFFTDGAATLDRKCREFFRAHLGIHRNREVLQALQQQEPYSHDRYNGPALDGTPRKSLLDLVEGATKCSETLQGFVDYMAELRLVTSVRVLLLLDQYNAFKSMGDLCLPTGKVQKDVEPEENPVAVCFRNINDLHVSGGVIAALSASYSSAPLYHDGNMGALVMRSVPFNDGEIAGVLASLLPEVAALGAPGIDQVKVLTNSMPREIARLARVMAEQPRAKDDKAKGKDVGALQHMANCGWEYTEQAKKYYFERINRLFQLERMGETDLHRNLAMAMELIERNLATELPPAVENSGLLLRAHCGYSFACIAQQRAFFDVCEFNGTALIEVLLKDKTISWRALELVVLLHFRRCERVEVATTDLRGHDIKRISMAAKRVVNLDNAKAFAEECKAKPIEKGTLVVCNTEGTGSSFPGIDFFLYDATGMANYISCCESAYGDRHKLKPALFEKPVVDKVPVAAYFRKCLGASDKDAKKGVLAGEERFVYITTQQPERTKLASPDDQVRVVSADALTAFAGSAGSAVAKAIKERERERERKRKREADAEGGAPTAKKKKVSPPKKTPPKK